MAVQLTNHGAVLGSYEFSADKSKLDLIYVYNLLCMPSQYSTGLPVDRLPIVIQNSICFGIYEGEQQIGFARVITDFSEFASIWDVFIDPEFRNRGLGKAFIQYILECENLKGIYRWFLMTENAHGLYKKFGFESATYNSYIMMMVNG